MNYEETREKVHELTENDTINTFSATEFEKSSIEKCSCCGAKIKIWKHRLTPGLVKTLMKFGNKIKQSGKNDLHIQKEIVFNSNEYNNFQKLRYFGLIAKVRNSDGGHIGGHWLLTRNGGAFLRGELPIRRWVKTFRNEIVERGDDDVEFIFNILSDNSHEYFQKEFPYDIAQ